MKLQLACDLTCNCESTFLQICVLSVDALFQKFCFKNQVQPYRLLIKMHTILDIISSRCSVDTSSNVFV